MGMYDEVFGESSSSANGGLYDDVFKENAKKQNKGIAGDTLTDLKRGVQQIPGAVTGIADIVNPLTYATGNRMADTATDWLGDKTGFKPSQWQKEAANEYSPERKASDKAISDAWENGSASDIAGSYLSNPRSVAGVIGQSIPSMIAGGGIARAGMKGIAALSGADMAALGKAAQFEGAAGNAARETINKMATTAGAIGEGAITAGQNMDQVSRDVDPSRAALTSLAAGAITGGIGKVSGRIANKLGLPDVETAMAGGGLNAGNMPWYKRIPSSMAQESLIQELPQSAQEQVWQNIAENKPWHEGVARQAIEGALAGAAMGGGAAIPSQNRIAPIPEPATLPEDGPLSSAVNAGIRSGATSLNAAEQFRQRADVIPAGSFGQMNEFADLVNSEQADLTNRREAVRDTIPYERTSVPSTLSLAAEAQRQDGIPFEGSKPQAPDWSVQGNGSFSDQAELANLIESEKSDVGQRRAEVTNKTNAARAERSQQAIAGDMAQDELAPKPVSPLEKLIASRTDEQLTRLAGQGQRKEVQQAAIAEMQRRMSAPAQPTTTAPQQQAATQFNIPENINAPKAEQVAQEAPQANDAQVGAQPSAASSIQQLQAELDKAEPFTERSSELTDKLHSAVTQDAQSSIDAGEMPVYKVTDHVSVAIHPSAQNPGMVQVTRYTKDGVIGDSQYNNIEEAVRFEGLTHKPRIAPDAAAAAIEKSIQAESEYQARKNAPKQTGPDSSQSPTKVENSEHHPAIDVKPTGQSTIAKRDDLVGAIMRVTGGKGIAANQAQIIVGDKANAATKVRGLFTNDGTADLGDVAMLLRDEEGYSVKDGEHLSELISKQAAGNPVHSMERTEREASANAEKEYKASVNQKATELGLKKVGGKRTLQVVEADILAKEQEIKRLESEAERQAIQTADILEDGEVSEAEFMRLVSQNVGYTEEEINAEAIRSQERADRKAETLSRAAADEQAQGSSSEGDGDQSPTQGTSATEAGTRSTEGEQLASEDIIRRAKALGMKTVGVSADRLAKQVEEAESRNAFDLTKQTNEQASAEFKRQQEEANKQDDEPAAPTVKADQVDLFNTQDALFSNNREQPSGVEDEERFEREMRSNASTEQSADDDIQTSGLRYVQFAKALAIARKAVADGVKMFPAQFHTRLDVTIGSADRLIVALKDEANPATVEAEKATDDQGDTDGTKYSFAGPSAQAPRTMASADKSTEQDKSAQGSITQPAAEKRILSLLGDKLGQVLLDSGIVTLVDNVSQLKNLAGAKYMVAWHGSPHDHNKFDSSKIGTGEGAQAYGHGLYFAGSRDVAEWYKENLGKPEVRSNGKTAQEYGYETPEGAVLSAMRAGSTIDTKSEEFKARLGNVFVAMRASQEFRDAARSFYTENEFQLEKGKLYQVELAPNEDEYLDWDRPLSEQSEFVQNALRGVSFEYPINDSTNGEDIYLHTSLDSSRGIENTGYKAASDYLHSIGIRGIRYLDGNSRSAGEGNSNYVIFSDDDVSITAKYAKQQGAIQGATLPDGRIALVLSNITADNFDGVFQHEGFHSSIKELVGQETYGKLMNQLDSLLKMGKGSQWVQDAKAAVPKNTAPENVTEEIGAYSIEQYVNGAKLPSVLQRWVQSFLSAIRTAIIQRMPNGKLKNWAVMNLKAQDLANLAMAGLKAKAAGQLQAQGREAMAYSTAFGKDSQHRTPLGDATEIEVDGIKRPALNSNGKPIHWSREGVENFWRWFSDSKVVDAEGRPLVVYHGTAKDFTKFDLSKSGESTGNTGFYGAGAYFSEDGEDAGGYALWARKDEDDAANVIPAYLSLKDPLYLHINPKDDARKDKARASLGRIVDQLLSEGYFGKNPYKNEAGSLYYRLTTFVEKADFERFMGTLYNELKGGEGVSNLARRAGFDGVMAEGFKRGENFLAEAVAFDPTQIKSATGNNGDFSSENPDIRYSKAAQIIGDSGPFAIPQESKLDDVIYAMQDKQVDLKRVVENIKKADGKLNDDIDPYLQEELFHGRSAKGVSDFLDFELKPLINEMRMRGVGMADFEEYLWNRHAEERNKQIAKINAEMPDGGSGIKTADANAYLDALPSGKKESYASLAKRIDSINKKSQEILVASGLEKQSTIDAWNGSYQHYVPLHREDVETGHMGTGKGYSIRGNSSKRATGSNRSVVDILANITQQRERNVVRAEKVRMSNALYGLAKANPNPDLWTVDEAPTERVVVNRGGKDEVVTRVVPGFAQRDNVIHTRIDGEDHYIIMNEREPRAIRMAQAIKNLDADQLGRVLSATAKATRFLASINTQFNPIFGIVNLVRDAQGAMLNLSTTELKGQQKKVLGYTVSALRGVYADIRAHRRGEKPNSEWANLYEEFKLAGGQTGFRDQYENAAQRGEAIQKELASMDRNFVLKRAGAVFDWLSDYNEMMENASRLAAYRAAKEHGMSPERAASLAKNITVNFNRKGQVATQMGALYAFFNASVQGTARLAETMTGPMGKKIFVGGLLLGSMQAMLLAAAGMGDDEPPEFVRERSLILPIGDGKYVSVPMPLGFHIIPNLARIPTEFVMSGFKNPANRIADLFGMFADTFNPIGNAGLSLQTIAPTVVDPLAALSENRDWTGKPIAKLDRDSMNPTPGYLRAKDTATTWSKGISYGLNLLTGGTDYQKGLFSPTPDQIDYLIGQATGGVGREATKLEQTVMSGLTGEDLPLYKIPLVGRFVGDTQGKSAEGGKFYAAMQRINGHENEIKGMREHNRGNEVGEYLAEHPEAKLVMSANHVERSIQQLNKVKRKAIEAGDSDRVKQTELLIAQQMKAFNKRVEALSQ